MSKDSPKDLEYYMAHPDEVPSDAAALATLLGGEPDMTDPEAQDAEDAEAEQGEDSATPGESEGGEVDSAEDTDPGEGSEAEEAPISSKDGKHTIPYAVLATERERRQAAERLKQELEARVTELQARIEAGSLQPAATTQTDAVAEMLSDEDIEAIVEDFPSMKKVIDYTKTLERQVSQFAEKFKQIEQTEQHRMQEEQRVQAVEVRAAVDANPVLRYWEQHDPERWQAAVNADNMLQSLPVNSNLTLEQRFEKAVSIVETTYGPTQLPDGYAVKAAPKASIANLAEAAEKKLEKTGRFKPKTLSDMPGGATPAADPLEDFASRSATELGAAMADMSPDQIRTLLSRFG